jgi:cysteinyl-tRNA synthetase
VLRYFFLASHYRGPINYSLEQADAALGSELKALGNVIGLLTVPAEEWFRLTRIAGIAATGTQLSDAEVEERIAARAAARARRDFRESDRIRDECSRTHPGK